ncbi:hypothetical protein AC1031_004198 [Aphanomyces cochlioides]|nr:hypothetical protein AC1031_004198 [Aphanomyces cochlioides]
MLTQSEAFGVVHRVVRVQRRETDPDFVRPDGIRDSLEDFRQEPTSVFERSAVLICACVGPREEELPNQVAVRAMDFDSIESCDLNGTLGRGGKLFDDRGDFTHCELVRYSEWLLAL